MQGYRLVVFIKLNLNHMNIIPFGEVAQDRYEISKRYGLIEKVGGIWRLTEKCKNAYDPSSYFYYLQGKVEKPSRIVKEIKTEKTVQEQLKSSEVQNAIDEILKL